MNNVEVGRYLAANFACSYEQKGDFRVVRVGDRIDRQGGNLVSYFCTSDLRVVHFVVGPVDEARFLQEAKFAVAAYRDAIAASQAAMLAAKPAAKATSAAAATVTASGNPQHGSLRPPTTRALVTDPAMLASIRGAHAAMFEQTGAIKPLAVELLRTDPLKGKVDYAHGRYAAGALESRWEKLAAVSQRVDALLAHDPLPPLRVIDSAVFRRLAGEEVNDQDGSVQQTVIRIEAASELGQPTALVLYNGTMKDWQRSDERRNLQRADVNRALKPFSVVHLPMKELPALSTLLKGFEVPEVNDSWGAQVLLLDCRHKQLDAVAARASSASVVAALTKASERNDLSYAESLLEQRRTSDARKSLYALRNSKDHWVSAKAKQLLATLSGSANVPKK